MSDRLSKLDDKILTQILSLLPIKKSASTSILSRRWRYLWTKVTAFRMIGTNFLSEEFYSTLIHCAKQLSWEDFDTIQLHLVLDSYRYQANIWTPVIREIIYSQNVKVINLWFQDSKGVVVLPPCVFTMQSLEVLLLSNQFELTLPGIIRLPCLEILEIHVESSQFKSLSIIVESCPLLEQLKVHALTKDKNRAICLRSKTLKHLSVLVNQPAPSSDSVRNYHLYRSWSDAPQANNEHPLRILCDAPQLVDIKFKGKCELSLGFLKNSCNQK